MAPIIPRHDLCADLRNDRDPELGDAENVGSASNRHIRIYVTMFMLDCSMAEAMALYQESGNPGLLDRPGRLETPAVVAEVLQLLAWKER